MTDQTETGPIAKECGNIAALAEELKRQGNTTITTLVVHAGSDVWELEVPELKGWHKAGHSQVSMGGLCRHVITFRVGPAPEKPPKPGAARE